MSLERTPPNKFSSDTNIPSSIDIENQQFLNSRKRKQPDHDLNEFEDKFNRQLLTWDAKITDCITNAVSKVFNAELTKITSMLSEINNNMIKLNTDNCNINKCLTETNKKLCDMEKFLNHTAECQGEFDKRLQALEQNMPQINDFDSRFSSLQIQISNMEQQSRQSNIEISNLPERRGENLLNILESLGEIIKCPIRPTDITAVHRVPHADRNNQRPKNVIVKFSNRMLRDNVIAACRAVRGLDSNVLSISGPPVTVYINEHLTLSNKLLFRQCREAAKKADYRFVWIKHGVILARKSETSPVLAIRSTNDLAKIK